MLLGLFPRHQIRPVNLTVEDDAVATLRFRILIHNDTGMKLFLRLLHPEKKCILYARNVKNKNRDLKKKKKQ